MAKLHDLDPHVFLGRITNGERLRLVAGNPSGTLWSEYWIKREDGYHYGVIGPCGSAVGPVSYEEAHERLVKTMGVLRRMDKDARP